MEHPDLAHLPFEFDQRNHRAVLITGLDRTTFTFDSCNRIQSADDSSMGRRTWLYDTVAPPFEKVAARSADSAIARPTSEPLNTAVTGHGAVPAHFATPAAGRTVDVLDLLFANRTFYEASIATARRALKFFRVPCDDRMELAIDAVANLVIEFRENPALLQRLGEAGVGIFKWLTIAIEFRSQKMSFAFHLQRRLSKAQETLVSLDVVVDASPDHTSTVEFMDQFYHVMIKLDQEDRNLILLSLVHLGAEHAVWAQLGEVTHVCPKTAKRRWLKAAARFRRLWKAREGVRLPPRIRRTVQPGAGTLTRTRLSA